VRFVVLQSALKCLFFAAPRRATLAVALLKVRTKQHTCLRLAGAIFVVLVCTLGLAGMAWAAFLLPTTTTLSSSPNPLGLVGRPVTFTAQVTTIGGPTPPGTVSFFDGGSQIGTATLAGGTATFTTSSLAAGSHSITAQYSGDPGFDPSTSAALLESVGDSSNLRAMQVSAMPVIAQISGQSIVGAINGAINSGFSDNPPRLTPNGGGFTYQFPLDQPIPPPAPPIGNQTGGRIVLPVIGLGGNGVGSLANGRQGGNGAPPGTRLIDMRVIPLPPGSGMPPPGETRFVPDEVVLQFGPGTTPQQIAGIAQRFGLTVVSQQTIGVLGRSVYTFRITNGQSVRQTIGAIQSARLNAAVQPNYLFGLTQDQNQDPNQSQDPDPDPNKNDPDADQGDPAQYIVAKLHLAEAHQISRGDNIVIAVIDSEIDFEQQNLTGAIADRYDAGCGKAPPDAHGTGMAGAIAAHGQLLGVAPGAKIIAICAFGGTGHPQSNTVNIINGLNYAIQHGARIVNMSFAGPHDPAFSQALQIAREKGVLLIAAAGNAGPKSAPLYPGADPSVMAVTATDENDQLFRGANQGEYVTIAAPGVNVLVPAPAGGAQLTTGTSVATANVSGVAALLLAHKPNLKPEEVRAILVASAKHLGSPGINPQFGAGLVDPVKALETQAASVAPPQRDSLNQFLAAPNASGSRVDDGFAALGYAGDDGTVLKAPPVLAMHRWLAWIDVQGADFNRSTFGSDLQGTQINALAGVSYKLTPRFLVGVLGGYEHFDYTSQAFNGVLRGDGWTTGGYLGWLVLPHLRFDVGGTWSDISTDDTSGLATGSFTGTRWLVTSGLTGTYNWQAIVLEPSARVFALWEHENGYTDSLGTLQPDQNFSTGRASGGLKVSYPSALSGMPAELAPYVGFYGDYYFSMDDATVVGLTNVPLLQGWSGRATAGVDLTFAGGASVSVGSEYGGIGADYQIWTWRVRGSVPF
jgi:Subtilase family/Bacterial Ig-like domain (group 3)/Autotransporter beta-domain